MSDEQIMPCGSYHAVSCGLDVECEVPLRYYEAGRSSETIWRMYRDEQENQQ